MSDFSTLKQAHDLLLQASASKDAEIAQLRAEKANQAAIIQQFSADLATRTRERDEARAALQAEKRVAQEHWDHYEQADTARIAAEDARDWELAGKEALATRLDALRAALVLLVAQWREIARRRSRPTGFRICADALEAALVVPSVPPEPT